MTSTYRSLAFATLASLTLLGCPDQGDPGIVRHSGGAGFDDVLTQIVELQCACLGEVEGAASEAQCHQEADELLGDFDQVAACIDDVLSRHPDARSSFECLLDAEYDYLECLTAEGCPAAFTCGDGTSIPEAWTCDGEDDCDDGSDEAVSCPAAHACGDGQTVPASWVCDGWDDCGDGSDERADCPVSCDATLSLAAEACPEPPEAFGQELEEQCFESVQVSEPSPGDCVDASCPDVPCDDGACDAQPAPRARDAASGRPSSAVRQAVRHTLRSR